MTTFVDSYRFAAAGGFDPAADIAWHSLLYADDPSKSPSDGDIITSWNNAGDSGLTVSGVGSGNEPRWRASVAALNNQAAFDCTVTQQSSLETASFTGIAPPYAIVVVGNMNTTFVAEPYLMSFGSNSQGIGRHTSSTWQVRNPNFVTFGTSDTNPHLFIVSVGASSTKVRVDGTEYTVSAGTNNATKVKWNADRCSGYWAFGGFIDVALSAGEISDLESWAPSYYGTP